MRLYLALGARAVETYIVPADVLQAYCFTAGGEAWRALRDVPQDSLRRRAALRHQMPRLERRRRAQKMASDLWLYGAHGGFC